MGTEAAERGARFALVTGISVVHEQGVSGGSAAWTSAFERLLVRRSRLACADGWASCSCGPDSGPWPEGSIPVNPYLRRLVLAYSTRSRERKAAIIIDLMRQTGARRLLLVGAMASGTELNEGIVERLVGASAGEVVSINLYDPGSQPWPYLVADGCHMPFADQSFDLVVSNAVIEHVGLAADQLAFVAETFGSVVTG